MDTLNQDKRAAYTLEDVGCYVDGARGIYAIDAIAEIAENHGWERPEDSPETMNDFEWAGEVEDEIDEYMNDKYGIEGAYWGRSEQGDWGLWTIEED